MDWYSIYDSFAGCSWLNTPEAGCQQASRYFLINPRIRTQIWLWGSKSSSVVISLECLSFTVQIGVCVCGCGSMCWDWHMRICFHNWTNSTNFYSFTIVEGGKFRLAYWKFTFDGGVNQVWSGTLQTCSEACSHPGFNMHKSLVETEILHSELADDISIDCGVWNGLMEDD